MHLHLKLRAATLLFIIALNAKAQDTRVLIKEGILLSNDKNYTAAIAKFKLALTSEPDNPSANYQLAFTLNASGKAAEAVPYLQRATASDSATAITGAAYALLGSIYDRTNQPQKAIQNLKSAIKINPGDHLLHYNLGLVYFRTRDYAGAENSAVNALKFAPHHPGSMRLYALVTFHQNKRAPALLALCQFLWLDPKGGKSAEAYGNLQSILSGGVLKPEPGLKPLNANNRALNDIIAKAARSASAKKYATATDKLTGQLKEVFEGIGLLTAKQSGNDSVSTVLAARYYALSKTTHLPVYTQIISQGSAPTAATWLKTNQQKVSAIREWYAVAK
ncbi:hypothetical protein DJ568_04515 [Mucilaginibacter hurinus]|uniref:Uncharacterized protein n=1 Tax=Mucilaginibacter hurinus TaxID=2201324 RepID=A0A367GRC0_9SPHI|nr:tetratricopeptide repeat protein [Mucilaginibacter hurinus]RCH56017.1 hypothetical protein DJ568_04515 [Mucilaginibacter hurinus]